MARPLLLCTPVLLQRLSDDPGHGRWVVLQPAPLSRRKFRSLENFFIYRRSLSLSGVLLRSFPKLAASPPAKPFSLPRAPLVTF